MLKISVESQKSIIGGARWACTTCGYLSYNHLFATTAGDMAYAHQQKNRGHKTIVRN